MTASRISIGLCGMSQNLGVRDLLVLSRGCIVSVICSLKIGNIRISHKLLLVVCCFKKHRVPYLRVSLLLTPVTLKSFPHGECLHETNVSAIPNGINLQLPYHERVEQQFTSSVRITEWIVIFFGGRRHSSGRVFLFDIG
jgi:hypothetical protein